MRKNVDKWCSSKKVDCEIGGLEKAALSLAVSGVRSWTCDGNDGKGVLNVQCVS